MEFFRSGKTMLPTFSLVRKSHRLSLSLCLSLFDLHYSFFLIFALRFFREMGSCFIENVSSWKKRRFFYLRILNLRSFACFDIEVHTTYTCYSISFGAWVCFVPECPHGYLSFGSSPSPRSTRFLGELEKIRSHLTETNFNCCACR